MVRQVNIELSVKAIKIKILFLRTNNIKLIMIVANTFQIIGSFMYFMGISTWFIISGRIVAGIGLGVVSATFSDVIKNTNEVDRSPILSKIMVGRQVFI